MYQQNKQSYNDILAIAEVPSQSNGKRTNYSVNSAGTVSYPYEKKKKIWLVPDIIHKNKFQKE